MKFIENFCLFITAPFWLPWVWIGDKMRYWESGADKIIRVVIQTIATIISSCIYILVIWGMFSGETSVRDDKYYERQHYYERKHDPGW